MDTLTFAESKDNSHTTFLDPDLKLLATALRSTHFDAKPKLIRMLAWDVDDTLFHRHRPEDQFNPPDCKEKIACKTYIDPSPIDQIESKLGFHPTVWLAHDQVARCTLVANRLNMFTGVITQGDYTRETILERFQTNTVFEELTGHLVDNKNCFFLSLKNLELRETLLKDKECAELFLEEYFTNHAKSFIQLQLEAQEAEASLYQLKAEFLWLNAQFQELQETNQPLQAAALQSELKRLENQHMLKFAALINKQLILNLRSTIPIYKSDFTIEEARQILASNNAKPFIDHLLSSTTLLRINPVNKKLVLAVLLATRGIRIDTNVENIILVDDSSEQHTCCMIPPLDRVRYIPADIIVTNFATGERKYNGDYTHIKNLEATIKTLFAVSELDADYYQAIQLLSSDETQNSLLTLIPEDYVIKPEYAKALLYGKIAEIKSLYITLQEQQDSQQISSSSSILAATSVSAVASASSSMSLSLLARSKELIANCKAEITNLVHLEQEARGLIATQKAHQPKTKFVNCRGYVSFERQDTCNVNVNDDAIDNFITHRYAHRFVVVKQKLEDMFKKLETITYQSIPKSINAATREEALAVQTNFATINRGFFDEELCACIGDLTAKSYDLATRRSSDEKAAHILINGILGILDCMQTYTVSFLNGEDDDSATNVLFRIDNLLANPTLLKHHHGIFSLFFNCATTPSTIDLLQKLKDICKTKFTTLKNAHGQGPTLAQSTSVISSTSITTSTSVPSLSSSTTSNSDRIKALSSKSASRTSNSSKSEHPKRLSHYSVSFAETKDTAVVDELATIPRVQRVF
ncbi:MAG: hypothetical protein M1561_06770 [Gammaproteobacteria bacterium]|nr:hypothetical protein [Gammaproteobacteria bacterium]